jgi:GT2 family glycosyltransferase
MNLNFLIILLNHNNWLDTVECIQSLNKSNVSDSNILIIENCSIDNSVDKLKEFVPAVKIIQNKKNLGFTGGNNVGIKYALENNFEYSIVLNNDTIIESKDAIRTLIEKMDKNSQVTLSTGRILYYPDKHKIWYDGGKLNKWRGLANHFNFRKNINKINLIHSEKYIDFISGCFMCIRLKDLSKLGYMDENFFLYLDDIEYSARAVRKNLKLMFFPQVVIYHKARGEEKHTPKMVYYSMRNRKLLINLHFGLIAKIYFEAVIIIKRILWFFINRKFYRILQDAIKDYKKKYFGLAPEYIK